MKKIYLYLFEKVKFYLGFLFVIVIMIGLVYGFNYHSINEVSSGKFIGNYSFFGTVNITDASIDGLALSSGIPSGTIIAYSSKQIPHGWLECDGSVVSRTVELSLFNSIGTTYGAGDGSTTFNLPDLRGEFIRGLDNGRGIDSGRVLGSTQNDQLQDHTHSVSHNGVRYQNENTGAINTQEREWFVPATISVGNPNSGNHGTETRPKNVAIIYLIKK